MSRSFSLKRMFVGLVMLLTVASLGVAAPIPQMINYQGTLTETTGQLVPDGSYAVEFNLYDVPSGGTALWNEKWDATTSPAIVTGGVFNVMLGAHNPIPTEFFADHPVLYLGVKVGADSEMMPRQRITSVGYAFAAGNGIPRGGIIMWSGGVNQIPEGWALCDGTNGTPDLRDRFVVGAGGGYAVGQIGGVNNNNISHSHTISSESPGTNSTGAHAHHIDVGFYNPIGDYTDGASDGSKNVGSESHGHQLVADTWSNGAHAHTVNAHSHGGGTGTAGSTSLENRPPFYALAFIMKL